MGTSRSAFEARSIFVASLVRPLYFRLRWGWEGNNALGICMCVGGSQTRGKGGVASVYEPNPKRRWSGLFLSPSRPSRPTLLPLSGHSAQQSAHAAAGIIRCVLMGVDCMRGLLDMITTQHPSGPQHAPTYRPLADHATPPPYFATWERDQAIYLL